jgi:hypothetical protein
MVYFSGDCACLCVGELGNNKNKLGDPIGTSLKTSLEQVNPTTILILNTALVVSWSLAIAI